jgi:hypothetical protein
MREQKRARENGRGHEGAEEGKRDQERAGRVGQHRKGQVGAGECWRESVRQW